MVDGNFSEEKIHMILAKIARAILAIPSATLSQSKLITSFCIRHPTTHYPLSRFITEYLSRPDVRTMLGVDPAVAGNFSSCSDCVGKDFGSALDKFHPRCLYVAGLLQQGAYIRG